MHPTRKSSKFSSISSKNKSVRCHFKALLCYECATMTWRNASEAFWALEEEEGGEFCFLWFGNLGQATVLDISLDLNWLTKECGSLQMQKFDICMHTTLSCLCWWLIDTEGWRGWSWVTHSNVPSHSTDMGCRFSYTTSSSMFVSLWWRG